MRTLVRVVALAVCLAGPAAGAARAQPSMPPVRAVTFDDVLAQVKAGTQPADLLTNCNVIFTLSPQQQAALVRAGAPAALVAALQSKRIAIGDVTDFVVILDCSGSMSDEIGPGQTKMDAAKKVVGELFRAIPNGRNLAFVVYGHDVGLECKAVKTVRPLAPINDAAKAELAAAVGGLKPAGHTPIAASLRVAGELLAGSTALSQVVLITDGLETCHGDPAAEAEALTQAVKGLRGVEVIGVGLKAAEEKDGVAAIARRGRGKFYDADTAADLRKAVAAAADVAALAADEDGFTRLADGGVWMIHKGDPNTWTIGADGVFTNQGKRGGWLMTRREYADFELRLEVKLAKGADTGIAFRNSLDTDPSFDGNQVQFADEQMSRGWKAITRTGGVHDVVAPQRENATKPIGQWNAVAVVVKGRQLAVTFNGTKVLDVDLAQYRDRVDAKEGGMFLHPDLLRDKGHVGLQSWDGKLAYRNVRIKAFPEADRAAVDKPAAGGAKSPAAPDWCVFTPTFATTEREIRAGTAFVVSLPDHPRPILLTAIHLLGPSGGLAKDVPPADVPRVVTGLSVSDCFEEARKLKMACDALVIADAAPVGKFGKAGDVLAFWGPEDQRVHRLELATEDPKVGDPVWMLASVAAGAPADQRLHPAKVAGMTESGNCYYQFDNAKIELRGTSGAPVVNAAGQVVAINVSGGTKGGKLLGYGNPVGRFKPYLEAAAKKASKPR